MTNYTTVAPWRTGDVVSATKLTQMTDNLAYVTGLYNQRHYPYDSGADVIDGYVGAVPRLRRPTQPWIKGKFHDAWICHNGDRLVVYAEITDNGNPIGLSYDKDGVTNPQHFALVNGVNVLQLNTTGFYQYQPVRIRIEPVYQTGYDDSLWVRYIYQTNSNTPSWPTLPAFTNGTASSAADLNALVAATDKARQCFEQPISSAYYFCDAPWVEQGFMGYVRRSHRDFNLDIVASGENTGYVFLNLNGQNAWGYTFPPGNTGFDDMVAVDLTSLGSVPAVGNWYLVQTGYNPQEGHEQACVFVWSMAEQPGKTYANFDTMARWAHGDLMDGDILGIMVDNLTTLNTNRHWINTACRTGYYRVNSPTDEPQYGRYSAYRVHRWLAYETFADEEGKRASPQILWASGNRGLQSYSLPAVDQPSFFDLESTPVKPGMYMRITGVKFAIQVPQVAGGVYA